MAKRRDPNAWTFGMFEVGIIVMILTLVRGCFR
jgi:hypothetical protein